MNNPPAFPVSFKWGDELSQYNGMTLRDYFAAKALQGILYEGLESAETATHAYEIADAMLAARETT